jgi:hypothetical protein
VYEASIRGTSRYHVRVEIQKEEYYYEEDGHPIENHVTPLLDSARIFLF